MSSLFEPYHNSEDVAIHLDHLAEEYDNLNYNPMTDEKRAKLEAIDQQLRTLSEKHNEMVEQQEYYNQPVYGWTCFHCGHRFYHRDTAQAHFGEEPTGKPSCLSAKEVRLENPSTQHE